MNQLNDFILNAMVTYGPSIFGLSLLVSGIGIPLPATLLVIAAGAFTAQQQMPLVFTFIAGLTGVVIGDLISFLLVKHINHSSQKIPAKYLQKTQKMFNNHAYFTIFTTRFLFTPLALPKNFIASTTNFSLNRFMIIVVVGELTWLLIYGSIGYFLSSKWIQISEIVVNLTGLLTSLVILILIVYWKYLRSNKAGIVRG